MLCRDKNELPLGSKNSLMIAGFDSLLRDLQLTRVESLILIRTNFMY